jgi:hypothetical protein
MLQNYVADVHLRIASASLKESLKYVFLATTFSSEKQIQLSNPSRDLTANNNNVQRKVHNTKKNIF